MGTSPAVVRAHGPLAVEGELVAALRAERDAIRSDPRRLASPIAIAVPSEALRVHVTALAAREIGALAGVRVQTLAGLAHEVLVRAGVPRLSGAAAAGILVLRAARAALAAQGDAFAAAAQASITDLLDAGFTPDLERVVVESALESEEAAGISALEKRVAAAVVRGAARAHAECAAHGVARHADVYAHAADALRGGPCAGGPRAVWLHGFTDATGLQGDLVEALAAAVPVRVFWDDAATGMRYGAALRARLGIDERAADGARGAGLRGCEEIEPTASQDPVATLRVASPVNSSQALSAFRARGAEAEVREVLRRVRRLVDAGVAPERIAIVAREPGPYVAPLRAHAARLAIPFSAEGAPGPLDAAGRASLARLDILREARRVPVDRWLAAARERGLEDLALLTGLRVLGAARLGAVAELDLARILGDRAALRLPFHVARAADPESAREPAEDRGDSSEDSTDESSADEGDRADAEDRDSSRTVARDVLARAVDAARALLADLDAWPASATGAAHAVHVLRVLQRLAAGADDPLALAAAALAREVPADLAITRLEFLDALTPVVETNARSSAGGRGGGVQFASAALARGRAFEHLFLLGLNAGVFPATAREDPLLGDDVRRLAQACLADLPLKRARAEEESATFAQLLAAAPHVTLSWQVADADDAPLAPSPLLDAAGIVAPEEVGICRNAFEADEGVPQPALEHALLAARDGGSAALAAVLEIAVADARAASGLDPRAASRIAAAQLATLAEIDRPPGPVEPLGPFFGITGTSAAGGRRDGDLAVTTLEGVARCPWQAFLTRVLRVKPPLDPLVGAPRIDARVTGTVAHALIAETAPPIAPPRRDGWVRLEDVEEQDGQAPAWPAAERLRAKALEHAARSLREEGLYTPGLDALVAARALELAAAARRLDGSDPTLRVLAAEVEGWIPIPGKRRLTFRADRVERSAGLLRLTDWKSGAVFQREVTGATTRARHLADHLRKGTHLQGFVYAIAGGEGRYVALKPDFREDANRVYSVLGEDDAARALFEAAVDALLAAWDAGAFFPRLVEPAGRKENPACASCEVAAACVRGDSGSRRRFGAFVQRAPAADERRPEAGAEQLVRRVFALHAPAPKEPAPLKPKPAPRRKKSAEEDA